MSTAVDRRGLRRVFQKFGAEVRGSVYDANDSRFDVRIVDYHSGAARIEFVGSPETFEEMELKEFHLLFGETLLGRFFYPLVLRRNRKLNVFVISLVETSKSYTSARSSRVDIQEVHRGMLVASDPTRLNESIYFRILNLSLDGCRVLSSKSNRHLVAGTELENAEIVLPGLGAHQVKFKIMNAKPVSNGIEFGGTIVGVSRKFEGYLRKYLLLNCKYDLDKDRDVFREIVSNQKDFRPLIRVVSVSTQEQYEECLKRRYSAYSAAEKVRAGSTWQEMEDSFDRHSIIYAIQVGQTVVGTTRIVRSSGGHELFPFEEYIPWSEIDYLKGKDRGEAAELSRLAIDPLFQGSDILVLAFSRAIAEVGKQQVKYPLCLATRALATHYKGIGAVPISKAVPHKYLKNESLTLYLFDIEKTVGGKMRAIAWFKVAKPALFFLAQHGFLKKRVSWDLTHYLKLPIELAYLFFKRLKSRKRR